MSSQHSNTQSSQYANIPSSPSTKNSATLRRFDAAKQGRAPLGFLSEPPKDLPAVRIGFVNPTVGYGLFAARNFSKDEFIFHEAPVMTALFNEHDSYDLALLESQYNAYLKAMGPSSQAYSNIDQAKILNTAFPLFAAKNGYPPLPYNEAHTVLDTALGVKLIDGRFNGSTISRQDYEAYIARAPVNNKPTVEGSREACLDFFKHYAFQVPQEGVTPSTAASSRSTQASIFILGCLINHCCPPPDPLAYLEKPTTDVGPNCKFRISPSHLAKFVGQGYLAVQATRDIAAGEELTWDYGKRRHLGFVCECETCKRAPKPRWSCSTM